ncbi:peptide N-acetyl-beta-D-glucosaminyl asparaginase amidase A-domain-containing protein [Cubamyces lactineus]|nr:peptide N-acetyl-beta-D-glucosaminyl asparaginase amidase A-domain-containing protein [Cubamyces lactineus]
MLPQFGHLIKAAATSLLLAALFVRAAVLVDFQVAQPPPLPQDAKQCTIQILQRTFGFSFGLAEVVQFTPPTDCGPPGSWAGISLNFTVTSNGTQFDRLGIFTFQNVEIWRTSTPEPTRGDGIIWTYLKDVTRYIPLFAKPGTFILQLDNLLETGLDGQYATTLHATFFASSDRHPPAPKANAIIPVTTLANDTGNEASVPPVFSLNVTVPRNAVQVFAELYASGNGNEEFWYFNTANEFLSSLPAGVTLGDGPFREVRMLVDGQVAGVAFPYAVIFTGGIVPTAWRPITSYGALDLPTYFIDLTPFVPILTDGNPHNISIDVVSAEDDHTINQNWFVSGNLQVVTDPSSKPTTGKITKYDVSPFAVTTTTGSVGSNGDVNVTVSATRDILIEAEITSGSGKTTHVVWSQNLAFSNTQQFLDNTAIQNVFQTATGTFLSTHNGVTTLLDQFSYPLNINLTELTPSGDSFVATFDHSYERTSHPAPFILGSTIHERQLASGFFFEAPTGNTGNGTNSNTFSYVDLAGNTYDREVTAIDNNITSDHQGGTLAPRTATTFPDFGPQVPFVVTKPRLPGARKIGN